MLAHTVDLEGGCDHRHYHRARASGVSLHGLDVFVYSPAQAQAEVTELGLGGKAADELLLELSEHSVSGFG
jgi:hypothetical protein